MDKAQEELNRASHILLDAEVRLRTINAQVLQLDKDIALIMSVEANLEENIRILKRKRVTVMVNEYKKARSDLETARARLAFLRVDRENCLKIERHAETVYENCRSAYERAFELLHNPPDNVLEFRRKDGR